MLFLKFQIKGLIYPLILVFCQFLVQIVFVVHNKLVKDKSVLTEGVIKIYFFILFNIFRKIMLDWTCISFISVYSIDNDHIKNWQNLGLGVERYFLVLLGLFFNYDRCEFGVWNHFIGESLSEMYWNSWKLRKWNKISIFFLIGKKT